jgi:hypothetical protein
MRFALCLKCRTLERFLALVIVTTGVNSYSNLSWAAGCVGGALADVARILKENSASRPPGDKLQRILKQSQSLSSTYEDANTGHIALVQLLQSHDLLPKGGHVHIRGPGENYMEWLVPLLARPDAKVSISDPEMHTYWATPGIRPSFLSDEYLKEVWEDILTHRPRIRDEFKAVATWEQFKGLVQKRVELHVYQPNERTAWDLGRRPGGWPEVDLLIARMPHSGREYSPSEGERLGNNIRRGVKNGGLVWLFSERVMPDAISNHSVQLPDFFKSYLPADIQSKYFGRPPVPGYLLQVENSP